MSIVPDNQDAAQAIPSNADLIARLRGDAPPPGPLQPVLTLAEQHVKAEERKLAKNAAKLACAQVRERLGEQLRANQERARADQERERQEYDLKQAILRRLEPRAPERVYGCAPRPYVWECADNLMADLGDLVPAARRDEIHELIRKEACIGVTRGQVLWYLDHGTTALGWCFNEECPEHGVPGMNASFQRRQDITCIRNQMSSGEYNNDILQARLAALVRAEQQYQTRDQTDDNGWGDEDDGDAMPDTLDVGGTYLGQTGAVHVIYGKRSSGKSWICAAWAAQVVTDGGYVLWVDFEATSVKLAARFRALGVADADRREHVTYISGRDFDTETILDTGREADLIVFDAGRGLTRAIAPHVHGYSGDDVEEAFAEVLRPLADDGAAVCVIHHEGKSGNATSGYGSERWESMPDIVFRAEAARGFSRGSDGHATLTSVKSRDGYLDDGTVVARFTMTGGVPELCGPVTRESSAGSRTSKTGTCADCGATLANYRATRCKSCIAASKSRGGGKFGAQKPLWRQGFHHKTSTKPKTPPQNHHKTCDHKTTKRPQNFTKPPQNFYKT